jgi:hypothetical protein
MLLPPNEIDLFKIGRNEICYFADAPILQPKDAKATLIYCLNATFLSKSDILLRVAPVKRSETVR